MPFVKETKTVVSPAIPRDFKPPVLQGFHFESWDTLERQLGITNIAKNCIFSDLSIGAWKGHWTLQELCNQLHIRNEIAFQPEIGISSKYQDYVHSINAIVDNESSGDKNFILAYRGCQKILSQLVQQDIQWVLIIAPSSSRFSWEKENLYLIELLAKGLKQTNCNIGIITTTPVPTPANWELHFKHPKPTKRQKTYTNFRIPGIMDKELSILLQNYIPGSTLKLSTGHSVFMPTSHYKKIGECDAIYSRIRVKNMYSHLLIPFEFQIDTTNVDTDFLQLEAAKRFSEGGYGIALRILENLIVLVNSAEKKAQILIQIQNIRIALLQFNAAAKAQIPGNTLPDEYLASLSLSKAWGLVMINHPEKAEKLFAKARSFYAKDWLSRIHLYLLNISALNKLKLGKIDEAFAYEKEIEKALEKSSKTDWHIFYINSINLARLYKKVKNYSDAELYYRKAFEVNTHLKSESDLLYSNICFAQLETLKENLKTSLIYWLRACIHWLSNEIPEALAPRVTRAIIKKTFSTNGEKVEAISRKLHDNLLEVARRVKIGLPSIDKGADDISFCRIENASGHPEIAIGSLGIGIAVSRKIEPSFFYGIEYNKLKKYTYQFLCHLLPTLPHYNSIYSDSQYGNELPSNSRELISSAIRYDISKIIFGTKKYPLSKIERKELFLSSKLELNPAIAGIEIRNKSSILSFKRYKSPIILNRLETEILCNIKEIDTIKSVFENYGHQKNLSQVLRKLEKMKCITIYL